MTKHVKNNYLDLRVTVVLGCCVSDMRILQPEHIYKIFLPSFFFIGRKSVAHIRDVHIFFSFKYKQQ